MTERSWFLLLCRSPRYSPIVSLNTTLSSLAVQAVRILQSTISLFLVVRCSTSCQRTTMISRRQERRHHENRVSNQVSEYPDSHVVRERGPWFLQIARDQLKNTCPTPQTRMVLSYSSDHDSQAQDWYSHRKSYLLVA